MAMKRDEVVSVLGPVDDATIAEIMSTDATVGELREALAWLTNDEALIGEGRPLPGTKIAALIEILDAHVDDDTDPALPGADSLH